MWVISIIVTGEIWPVATVIVATGVIDVSGSQNSSNTTRNSQISIGLINFHRWLRAMAAPAGLHPPSSNSVGDADLSSSAVVSNRGCCGWWAAADRGPSGGGSATGPAARDYGQHGDLPTPTMVARRPKHSAWAAAWPFFANGNFCRSVVANIKCISFIGGRWKMCVFRLRTSIGLLWLT
jgi:hypothetical protein